MGISAALRVRGVPFVKTITNNDKIFIYLWTIMSLYAILGRNKIKIIRNKNGKEGREETSDGGTRNNEVNEI